MPYGAKCDDDDDGSWLRVLNWVWCEELYPIKTAVSEIARGNEGGLLVTPPLFNRHSIANMKFCLFFLFRSLDRWKYVMIFLLANTLACVTLAVLVNINDKRKVKA